MFLTKWNTGSIPDSELDKIYSKMPAIRQQKADRLKIAVDRANCIVAWDLLEQILGDNGVDIYDYIYSVDDNGKPYLVDCPLHFSISHSADVVCVAVSDSEVGVDIQKVVDDYDRVSKRVCTANERLIINDKFDFCRIWAYKEATVKCVGTGIADMTEYDFSAEYDSSFEYSEERIYDFYIVECKRASR